MVEVAETITVTGDAPVVDARTTALVNDFGVAELQEVPSATDVWAVLGQTAGVRMRGFDVGGSHKSQQTSYESFGVRDQNRVLADGVDTTEGEGGTGFYFDYYSIGEFTTTAAGNDVEMTAPGSLVMMTMNGVGVVADESCVLVVAHTSSDCQGSPDRLHELGPEGEAETGSLDRCRPGLGARPGELELGPQGGMATRLG